MKEKIIFTRVDTANPIEEAEQERIIREHLKREEVDDSQFLVVRVQGVGREFESKVCKHVSKWIEDGRIDILAVSESGRFSQEPSLWRQVLSVAHLEGCRVIAGAEGCENLKSTQTSAFLDTKHLSEARSPNSTPQ